MRFVRRRKHKDIKSLLYYILFFGAASILLSCLQKPNGVVNPSEKVVDFSPVFDSSVQYIGPKATMASITGSPFWPFSHEEVIGKIQENGWALEHDDRVDTPYGKGPRVLQFSRKDRKLLWIPDYGWTLGQDDRLRMHQEILFWILWKAGVKIMVAGGNSGSSDWRTGDEAVRPGDMVFPWSFKTRSWYRGLPGTKYETVWGNPALRRGEIIQPFMGEPFSARLASEFYKLAAPYEEKGPVRKIHTPKSLRIALIHPESITFETNFDVLYWQTIARSISENQPDKPPVIPIHGDCINPILATFLEIEMLYYHIVSNVAQGLPAKADISEEKDKLIYARDFGEMALDLELKFFEGVTFDGD